MAYEAKRLFISRCVRCGKPLYKGDDAYYCTEDNVYLCPICAKATHYKCPICQKPLQFI